MELELTLNKLKNYSRKKLLDFEVQNNYFVDRTVIKDLADRTAQKQQQTWESDNTVRCSLY